MKLDQEYYYHHFHDDQAAELEEDSKLMNKHMEEDDDEDEAEETLSFCDLPMYSSSAEWEEDYSRESQSSSSISSSSVDVQDCFEFEFFSQELSPAAPATTAAHHPPENVIFCGKVIPYKQPPFLNENARRLDINASTEKKKTNRSFFRWSTFSFYKPKSSKPKIVEPKGRSSMAINKEHQLYVNGFSRKSLPDPSKKHMSNNSCRKYNNKNNRSYGVSVRKLPILTSSPGKSKWYLYLFGLGRFPTEMELKDMKNRQSRRSPSSLTMFGLRNEDDGADDNRKVTVSGGGGDEGRGLWGLIKTLSCGGHHHSNTLVKASIGCIPRV